MTTMTPAPGTVTGGVDTHSDVHVAAAVDHLGGVLGSAQFRTTPAGYRKLLVWLQSFGPLHKVGVEGTGSYGAALARHLAEHEVTVVEVARRNRQVRRRHGKTDVVDAIAAARAVLSGEATATRRATTGRSRRCGRSRWCSAAQTRPAPSRSTSSAPWSRPHRPSSANACATSTPVSSSRPAPHSGSVPTTTVCRPSPAGDAQARAAHRSPRGQLSTVSSRLHRITRQLAPELTAPQGVGADVASTLLVTAGDNPHRLERERSFALCGSSPIPANSGKTQHRHRLNRGGDRQANAALWRIALVRLSHDPRTRDYMKRRISEGKTKAEALRCLKRYIAREVFNALPRERLALT
jgi:transposase